MRSQEEISQGDPLLNPLLIPHIIKSILSYTSFPDLKSARLVCKAWAHFASQPFQLKSKLRFHNFRHLDYFMSLHPSSAPPSNLLRNVCLHGRDFQDWVILLKPFFSSHGHAIKSLEITHGIGEVTEEFLLQLVQHVNIEELTLSGSSGSLYGSWANDGGFQFHPSLPSVSCLNVILSKSCFKNWSSVRTFFIDLLSSFPNVTEITLLGRQFTELFLYLPPELSLLPQLQRVHMQLFNSDGLSQFTSRQFGLTHLELDIQPLIGLHSLHSFLTSFASSLKGLKLKFSYEGPYNYAHNATTFPSSKALIKLESLELYGYWGNLYFLEDFTNLKKVIVEKMLWEIAFPQGPQVLSPSKRKIIRFYDQSRSFLCLNT